MNPCIEQMSSSKVCIVGTGAAGLLTLFSLSFTKIPPENVVCIDPYHDGGALQRNWSSVMSNTVWTQMVQIATAKGITQIPSPWRELDQTLPTHLYNYISFLRYLTKSYLQKCETIYATVHSIEEDSGRVKVSYGDNQSLIAKICIVATGSIPKQLDYPIPTIPLEKALCLEQLKQYVQPNQRVSIFGSSHSGTLVASNLHKIGAHAHIFYKNKTPFVYEREGEYDGLREESEVIADQILAGEHPLTKCHSLTNTADLIRYTRKSDWVVYAIGFERTGLTSKFTYDGTTGRIHGLPNTWGFGIAFPNQAPDGVHWDVGLPCFYLHIEKQIPSIVESFYA